ncbi:MAG TPA: PEP-CTERM sorting domain-containing protein [Tepidisphaeraceae bacterium]|nr:PEP-CTERM sorting domain-containing protein [Tepidisphaeraceae bacterium]
MKIFTTAMIVSAALVVGPATHCSPASAAVSGAGFAALPGLEPKSLTSGFSFIVGARALSVSDLGIWDEGSNGLTNSHEVSIWTDGGTLLGETVVPAGTSAALSGQFRFTSRTSPVRLEPNERYVIGATFRSGDADGIRWNQSFSNVVFSEDVLEGDRRFSPPAFGARALGAAFPALTNGRGGATFGPNLKYAIVPEPSSLLALLGIGGFSVLRRRR